MGDIFHGLLGGVLLALIVGHAGRAIWHRRVADDDGLARLAGAVPPRSEPGDARGAGPGRVGRGEVD